MGIGDEEGRGIEVGAGIGIALVVVEEVGLYNGIPARLNREVVGVLELEKTGGGEETRTDGAGVLVLLEPLT